MTRVAVLPRSLADHSVKTDVTLPATTPSTRLSASAATATSTPTSSTRWLYIIQPVHKLPTIDVTHTLAGVLVGRRHAQRINHWVIRTASRYSTLWHTLGITFVAVCFSIFFVHATFLKTLVTVALVALIGPVLWIHAASLCWDMLRLLLHTYEFWFIQIVNAANFVVWIALFRDIRILAMFVICLSCILAVVLDANLHMRAIVLRLFVVGAPSMLVALVMVTLRLTPDVTSTPVTLSGVAIDIMDVMTSGSSTIAYFMAMRVVHSRRLLMSFCSGKTLRSTGAPDIVQCGLYVPVCRLVPYDEWVGKSRTLAREPRAQLRKATAVQLELVDRDQLRIIDARDTLLVDSWLPGYTRIYYKTSRQIAIAVFNLSGFVGCGSLLGLCVYQVIHSTETTLPSGYVVVSCSATLLFVIACIPNYQRTLLRCVALEIDAWFISIQATMVALGACDALLWDQRSLFVVVAWLWCHWTICLDALPPVTRRRLALSRWLIVLVNITLLLCPLWLVQVLFFSAHTTPTVRNRVILRTQIANVDVRTEMLSFLASRIFTLWMWMGRFLWRECFRPHDAFKLIKHRVQFPVYR